MVCQLPPSLQPNGLLVSVVVAPAEEKQSLQTFQEAPGVPTRVQQPQA